MIFRRDDTIDDDLLELAKRFQKLVKKKILAKWDKEHDFWILSCENYCQEICCIKYSWIEKKKYEVIIGENSCGAFHSPKEAVNTLAFWRYMEGGISSEVIKFLAEKSKKMEIREAIDLIYREAEFSLTNTEMEILGIKPQHKGAITGKKFGL